MKALLLALLMFGPLTFGQVNTNSMQNIPVLTENNARVLSPVDEFLEYWDVFRQTPTCDVTYDQFKDMYDRFMSLSETDRAIVAETQDKVEPQYKIKDIISTLVSKFYTVNPKSDFEKETLEQSTTIIIIVVAAVFGMSTILIFFILKNNKIIQ